MRPLFLLQATSVLATTLLHKARPIEPRQDAGTVQILVTNKCADTIWPGVSENNGLSNDGFELASGDSRKVSISSTWKGRIWGRTNCTFPNGNSLPGACLTGECGAMKCVQAGNPPATLAEFDMSGAGDQAYYDISLVDGYNLPMAIVLVPNGVPALSNVKLNQKNPACVGSVNGLAPPDFNPYSGGNSYLGTTSGDELPFEKRSTAQDVSTWCPFDLLVSPPPTPGNGVYPYPDGNIQRPAFNPCSSACLKYRKAKYCCTDSYGRGKCQPNYYSRAAKAICPDTYTFAYEDTSSLFSVDKGGSWEVIFCPGGRSTNILAGSRGN